MSDLIERQAAIDALKNERSDWNCDYNVPVDHCIDAIYSVPSAQPIDLQELEDRFGVYVRFVVNDMLTGEGKRWTR